MPCFHPLKGWASKALSGGFTTSRRDAFIDLPRTVPCGQCSGCRLERSRQWAVRCHHEASLHENNCFITLTYNDEHLPPDRSLTIREFQLFIKRLRKKYGNNIRYYACGEYGENYGRPHYHACLFNHDFTDKKLWKQSRDNPLYRSASLEALWIDPETKKSLGYSSVGEVTFQSAAYVARYIMKKRLGKNQDEYYVYIDDDGVVHQRLPEFTLMSRRPGIGAGWLQKFATDVYPDDFVIINGKRVRPPRYYDQNFELVDSELLEQIKWTRKKNLRKYADNNTPERLAVREKIQDVKVQLLQRNHDLKGS